MLMSGIPLCFQIRNEHKFYLTHRTRNYCKNFEVFLTVNLSVTLVNDQFDAQFFIL